MPGEIDEPSKCLLTPWYFSCFIVTVTYWCFYQPQWSCGQGNIFTPVCHSVHRGGWWYPTRHWGRPPQTRHTTTPLDQTPPWPDTPWTRHTTPQTIHSPPGPDPPGPGTTPQSTQPPPGSRLRHTVYERPVRILLECILVVTILGPVNIDMLVMWKNILFYHSWHRTFSLFGLLDTPVSACPLHKHNHLAAQLQ